jgi:hypothetical protein
MISIKSRTHKLSDGSTVSACIISQDDDSVIAVECITERDAMNMATILHNLIKTSTVETVA